VLDDFARIYADRVNSNKRWEWVDIPGDGLLNETQRIQIREVARVQGYIPTIPRKPGGYPDFSDVIHTVDNLPEEMWSATYSEHFSWLDSRLPNGARPAGYTWHHSEIPGRMELVPFGTHHSTNHIGGRSPGYWAYTP